MSEVEVGRWRAVDKAEHALRICKREGCDQGVRLNRLGISMGLCSDHFVDTLRITNRKRPAVIHVGADGYEAWTQDNGYVLLYGPNGTVPEHKYVMERELGRAMRPGESVHHKNGIKSDNSPENLELWVVQQPAGQRVADLIAFIARQYPGEMRAALEALDEGEVA